MCYSCAFFEYDVRLLSVLMGISLFKTDLQKESLVTAKDMKELIVELDMKENLACTTQIINDIKVFQTLRNKVIHCNFIEFHKEMKKYYGGKKYSHPRGIGQHFQSGAILIEESTTTPILTQLQFTLPILAYHTYESELSS